MGSSSRGALTMFSHSIAIRSRRLALGAVAVLIAGCSGHMPTRPVRDFAPALTMSLTVSSKTGDPANPITVTARVTNVGGRTVNYYSDCIRRTPGVFLHSPNRDNIMHPCGECPNAVCPGCAGDVRALAPGEMVESVIVYDGQLLNCDGAFVGPSGVYSVDAWFDASTSSGQVVTVADNTTFTWTTPAPR